MIVKRSAVTGIFCGQQSYLVNNKFADDFRMSLKNQDNKPQSANGREDGKI